MRDVVARSTV